MDQDFFAKQYFEALTKQLAELQEDMKDIKSKVNYMYGFAAGLGFLSSLIFSYLKDKFFSH